MMDIAGPLAGGFLLGFAGSFHCACMCGAIASGSLMLLNPPTAAERLATLVSLQAGRVSLYALAGGVFAGTAGLTLGPETTAGTFKALQWISSAILVWVGFTMAGLLPRPILPAIGSPLRTATQNPAPGRHGISDTSPFAIGLMWGMTPCPMVYAALVPATLTGTAAGGVAWMAGFGLGTAPSVLATALGISTLSRVRRWRGAEVAAGLAVALYGFLSAAGVGKVIAVFCGVR